MRPFVFTGAVNNVGVVEIKQGIRIADAVDAANGFSEDADISQINNIINLVNKRFLS